MNEDGVVAVGGESVEDVLVAAGGGDVRRVHAALVQFGQQQAAEGAGGSDDEDGHTGSTFKTNGVDAWGCRSPLRRGTGSPAGASPVRGSRGRTGPRRRTRRAGTAPR